jgi:hypothetical protein
MSSSRPAIQCFEIGNDMSRIVYRFPGFQRGQRALAVFSFWAISPNNGPPLVETGR